jgi:hypothetical protein
VPRPAVPSASAGSSQRRRDRPGRRNPQVVGSPWPASRGPVRERHRARVHGRWPEHRAGDAACDLRAIPIGQVGAVHVLGRHAEEQRFTGATAASLISQADIAESTSYGSRRAFGAQARQRGETRHDPRGQRALDSRTGRGPPTALAASHDAATIGRQRGGSRRADANRSRPSTEDTSTGRNPGWSP